jgi:hypothetical protein
MRITLSRNVGGQYMVEVSVTTVVSLLGLAAATLGLNAGVGK